MTPVIEEPPWVVSQHFDDSLVAWQQPPQFLQELGHSVSASGPAGVVEDLAVAAPPVVQPEPPAADEVSGPLPLAVPTAAAGPAGPDVSVRRLPGWTDEDSEPAPAYQPPEADAPAEPEAEPAAASPGETAAVTAEAPAVSPAPSPVPAPAPMSDLVGSAPIAPVVQTLVSPEAPSNRFVQAGPPTDLPLAQLPSAPMPRELAEQYPPEPPAPEAPARLEPPSVPAPAPTIGLVGDRSPVEARSEPAPPASPAPPAPPVEAGGPGSVADLPLAVPPSTGDAAPDETVNRIPWAEPAPDPVSYVAPPPAAAYVAPPQEAPAAEPLAPEPSAPGPEPIAPLVGQAPPIAEPEPLAPSEQIERPEEPEPYPQPLAPTAGPRPAGLGPALPPAEPVPAEAWNAPPPQPAAGPPPLGLGEPMTSVPATAIPWDVTRMSRDQQIGLQRSIMRRQRAASARFEPPNEAQALLPLARPPAPPVPERPEPLYAGSRAPVVALESFPPVPTEEPGDVPGEGEGQVPIVSRTPMLGSEPRRGTYEPADFNEGAEVRAAVGRQHDLDLSTVPVYRTEGGAAQAKQMQARAFTSPQGVVIPPSAGSLNIGEGQALLAHELTHVAQRARLGPTVPAEDSPAGQVLEAEAETAGLVYAQPSSLRPLPVDRPAAGDRAGALPLAGRPTGLDQEALASSVAERLSSTLMSPAPFGGEGLTTTMTHAPMTAASFAPPPIQRAADDGAGAATATAPDNSLPVQSSSATTTSPVSPFKERPSDEDLYNLTHWLYPLISLKIKGELREGRERLGMVTDHYRRW